MMPFLLFRLSSAAAAPVAALLTVTVSASPAFGCAVSQAAAAGCSVTERAAFGVTLSEAIVP